MNLTRITILLIGVVMLASCGTFKPASKNNQLLYTQAADAGTTKKGPRFLNVKSVEHGKTVTTQTSFNNDNAIIAAAANTTSAKTKENTSPNSNNVNYTALQTKYAEKLSVEPSEIKNTALYQSIESWYGTRYVFGGTSHRGVDCSSLMQHLYKSTYSFEIPRTAVTQYRATTRISQDELKEGDLVFFHTTRAGISHVGFYLGNRRFIHASSSRGVTISSLDESYYVKCYRGGGRFPNNYKPNAADLEETEEAK
jgi:cell wall-associated NlpC family hydrolase